MIAQAASETNWIVAGGATSVLLWVVIGFIKGWIHTDREFQRTVKDQEFYREMALRGVGAAEQIGQVTREVATSEIDRLTRAATQAVIEAQRREKRDGSL